MTPIATAMPRCRLRSCARPHGRQGSGHGQRAWTSPDLNPEPTPRLAPVTSAGRRAVHAPAAVDSRTSWSSLPRWPRAACSSPACWWPTLVGVRRLLPGVRRGLPASTTSPTSRPTGSTRASGCGRSRAASCPGAHSRSRRGACVVALAVAAGRRTWHLLAAGGVVPRPPGRLLPLAQARAGPRHLTWSPSAS